MQLALSGALPLLPQGIYAALELLALGAAVGWYALVGVKKYPELAFVLATLPLWFAWRSLTTYFYFGALPMIALALAWRPPIRKGAPARIGGGVA